MPLWDDTLRAKSRRLCWCASGLLPCFSGVG